jgi:DNA-binding transcriptional ArsR family regulator
MTATFEVVADDARRQILDLLVEEERAVGELVDRLALSQPSVSKHLKVLREAGLVEARIEAQRRIYRVRPDPLREIDEWLTPYRQRWAAHLNALERHLEVMDGTEQEEQA